MNRIEIIQNELENEILSAINAYDEITTSDMRGIVAAFVSKCLQIGRKEERGAMAAEYSDPEKTLIGERLACALYLNPDPDALMTPGRIQTAWGNKTPRGIFETFRRIGQEIENGTITTNLLKL